MESTHATPRLAAATPSDRLVALTIQRGLQDVVLYTATGLLLGGLAGVVLRGRVPRRQVLPALGGGVGAGAAWTRTSVQLEELLGKDRAA